MSGFSLRLTAKVHAAAAAARTMTRATTSLRFIGRPSPSEEHRVPKFRSASRGRRRGGSAARSAARDERKRRTGGSRDKRARLPEVGAEKPNPAAQPAENRFRARERPEREASPSGGDQKEA